MRKLGKKKTKLNRKNTGLLLILAISNVLGIGFSSWAFPANITYKTMDGVTGNVGAYTDALSLNEISFSNIGLDGFYETGQDSTITNIFQIKVKYTIDLASIYAAVRETEIHLYFTFTPLNFDNFFSTKLTSDTNIATLGSSFTGILNSSSVDSDGNQKYEYIFENAVTSASVSTDGTATFKFLYKGSIDDFEDEIFNNCANFSINCDSYISGGSI